MKKYIGIVLVSVCLVQVILPLVLYQIGMIAVRSDFNARFNRHRNDVFSIFFAKEEKICWKKEGKEFIKDGKMYDVLSSSDSAGGVLFLVYPDIKEDKLIAKLKNNYTPDPENSSGTLMKKWHKWTWIHKAFESPEFKHILLSNKRVLEPIVNLISPNLDVEEPPPDGQY